MAESVAEVSTARAEVVRDFARSELFERTFSEGMELVEETAAYLDGEGRRDSKLLSRAGALSYAGESMRLTTRLMQVASWLLVQRSVADGDVSVEEASKDKYRLSAREVCTGRKPEAEELLPAQLVELLGRRAQLYDRIDRLDRTIYSPDPVAAPEGARGQLGRLASAFGGQFGE